MNVRVFFSGFISDDTIFYVTLFVLVSIGSFGLGRLEVDAPVALSSTNQAGVVLTEVSVASATSVDATTGQLVGSKNGSKYHALWCPGASQIKDSNKVFFASIDEAQSRGYSPAGNCADLK